MAYAITSDNYFTKDQPAKSEELRNYITVTTQPMVQAGIADICTSEEMSIAAGQSKTIEIKFPTAPVMDCIASIVDDSGGTFAISSNTFYAWGASVTVGNSGADGVCKVKIRGYQLSVSGEEVAISQDADSIWEFGLLKYELPKNHLIQTREIAEAIAAGLLASYKDLRKDININWRGNPALELGDEIQVPEYKKNGLDIEGTFVIYKNKLDYDGALSSTTDGRKI